MTLTIRPPLFSPDILPSPSRQVPLAPDHVRARQLRAQRAGPTPTRASAANAFLARARAEARARARAPRGRRPAAPARCDRRARARRRARDGDARALATRAPERRARARDARATARARRRGTWSRSGRGTFRCRRRARALKFEALYGRAPPPAAGYGRPRGAEDDDEREGGDDQHARCAARLARRRRPRRRGRRRRAVRRARAVAGAGALRDDTRRELYVRSEILSIVFNRDRAGPATGARLVRAPRPAALRRRLAAAAVATLAGALWAPATLAFHALAARTRSSSSVRRSPAGGGAAASPWRPPRCPAALTAVYVACLCALAALAPRVRAFQLARACSRAGFAAEFAVRRRGGGVRRYLADVERRRLREALARRAGSRYVAADIVERYLGAAAFEEWGDLDADTPATPSRPPAVVTRHQLG